MATSLSTNALIVAESYIHGFVYRADDCIALCALGRFAVARRDVSHLARLYGAFLDEQGRRDELLRQASDGESEHSFGFSIDSGADSV